MSIHGRMNRFTETVAARTRPARVKLPDWQHAQGLHALNSHRSHDQEHRSTHNELNGIFISFSVLPFKNICISENYNLSQDYPREIWTGYFLTPT